MTESAQRADSVKSEVIQRQAQNRKHDIVDSRQQTADGRHKKIESRLHNANTRTNLRRQKVHNACGSFVESKKRLTTMNYVVLC